MASFGGRGHLLMPAAMRASRAGVKAGERRVAEPHSIAFSCRRRLQKHVVYCLLCETILMHICGWVDGRVDG